MIVRVLSALSLAAATAILAPAAAVAQDDGYPPPPAPPAAPAPPPRPPAPSFASYEDVVRGHIVSFDGQFHLQVRDTRGYLDNVELHQGTIINPTGLTLAPGMSVIVRGFNRGYVLAANEIDTPYQRYGAVPVYPYGGPRVSVGLGFGFAFGHDWR